MKKYLFTGLVILLPFALTLIVIIYLFNLLTNPFFGIIQGIFHYYAVKFSITFLQNEQIIVFLSRVMALGFLFLLILVLGICARKFFFDPILRFTNNFFSRIPFVKTVYKLSKDVTKAMFTEGKKTIKETVLAPFPSKSTYALGFTTGEVADIIRKTAKDAEVCVFIPTAPHPVSGFLLLCSRKHLHEVDITPEETIKYLLSFGTFHPEGTKEEEKK